MYARARARVCVFVSTLARILYRQSFAAPFLHARTVCHSKPEDKLVHFFPVDFTSFLFFHFFAADNERRDKAKTLTYCVYYYYYNVECIVYFMYGTHNVAVSFSNCFFVDTTTYINTYIHTRTHDICCDRWPTTESTGKISKERKNIGTIELL